MNGLQITRNGRLFLILVAAILAPSFTQAQGTLIVIDHPLPRPIPRPRPLPVPPATYALKEISIRGRLTDQVAHIQVSQTFTNTGSSQIEAQFLFPLPYDGAIDSLTLLVDGKEFPAKLLTAAEARQRYQAIVRSNKDPALLEYVGVGLFQTSVFPIPANASRTITLTYHQLLRQEGGLTDFVFPLSTAKYTSQAVGKVDLELTIESAAPIKNVYSPTYPVEIQRPEANRALVKWQRTQETPTNDFRLFYDVGNGALAAKVISYRPKNDEDGYYLLLANPPALEKAEPAPKTVVFIVDKSGSMSGEKMNQAKGAMKFVLENLREGDLFNIVSYEGGVDLFRPELQRYNAETRQAALGYVAGLYAGGGTNIADALKTGLTQLQDRAQPSYILFLTDGLPTVGMTKETEIAALAKSANQVRARILPFGVGFDLNSRLLDRLARENFGLTEFVRPDEDIEAHVSKVFSRLTAPVMADVEIAYAFDQADATAALPISRTYPQSVFDLFAGQQVVVVGRYRQNGVAKVTIRGTTAGKPVSFDFPAEFAPVSNTSTLSFVEKLWASRRIGEIIDQLDLQGQNPELVKELVELSTRHGILTPYTSFLADETAKADSLTTFRIQRRATEGLVQLQESSGRAGFEQRAEKGRLQSLSLAPAASPLGVVVTDTEGKQKTVDTVRAAGKEALYARGAQQDGKSIKLLVSPETASLDLVKDKAAIREVERYSEAYFELVDGNSPEENLLFVQQNADEQLLVKLRGQVYLVK